MENLLISVVGWLIQLLIPVTQTPQTIPVPSPTPPTKFSQISLDKHTYSYVFFAVTNHHNLQLIDNYASQLSSQAIKQQFDCVSLANGGFYTPQNQPLGWFYTSTSSFPNSHTSALTNGFYYINPDGSPQISFTKPQTTIYLGLQSGPVLVDGGNPIQLSLNSDKNSPRTVAAINFKKQTIFIHIFSSDDHYSGPKLAQLPQIISLISNQEHLNLNTALNLDGGSASTFFHEQIQFTELKPVGSIFCLLE